MLADHRKLLRDAFSSHQGTEVDIQGDALFNAFAKPTMQAMPFGKRWSARSVGEQVFTSHYIDALKGALARGEEVKVSRRVQDLAVVTALARVVPDKASIARSGHAGHVSSQQYRSEVDD